VFSTLQVKPHPYVRESDECKPIVIETLKFLYDLDMDEEKTVRHGQVMDAGSPHLAGVAL